MPNVNVGLDIRNSPSSGKDGYTNTTSSANTIYSYKYSGGSDGLGGVDVSKSGGSGTITVQVGGDPRYTIPDVTFNGDIKSQLSWAHGKNNTIAIITDTDTSTGNGYYSVLVNDGTANCTFPCDPPIRNSPDK